MYIRLYSSVSKRVKIQGIGEGTVKASLKDKVGAKASRTVQDRRTLLLAAGGPMMRTIFHPATEELSWPLAAWQSYCIRFDAKENLPTAVSRSHDWLNSLLRICPTFMRWNVGAKRIIATNQDTKKEQKAVNVLHRQETLLQNGVEGRARDPTHSRRINRKTQATPYFERRVTPTSSHHRILVPWPSLQLQSILLDPVGSDAWPLIGLGSDVDTQIALKPFTLLVKCNTKSWVCIP